MGFLSDNALRVSALVVGVSGLLAAVGIARSGTAQVARPITRPALAGATDLAPAFPSVAPHIKVAVHEPVRVRVTSPAPRPTPTPSVKGLSGKVASPAATRKDPKAVPPVTAKPAVPAAARVSPKAVAPVAVIQPVTPTLALVGVTGVNDRDSAWLVDVKTGERQVASVGESVFGYTIKGIRRDAVTLVMGGGELEIRLGAVDVQTIPETRTNSRVADTPPVPPSAGGNSNAVYVTTYVNVYPPDNSARDNATEVVRSSEPAYTQPRSTEIYPSISKTLVISGRGRLSGRPTYGNSGRSRAYNTRRSGRITNYGSISNRRDLAEVETIVNPQTVRRLGVTGSPLRNGSFGKSYSPQGSRYRSYR